jgi:ribonuclease-3
MELDARILKLIPTKDSPLLRSALTHRSWANEMSGQAGMSPADIPEANERLEFLGDSVLGLVIARELYHRLPEEDEGRLSKAKARLVSATVLARHARQLDLGKAAFLGRGEERTGGRERVSILANVLEAVIGAVFLAEGLSVAEKFILELWGSEIETELAGPGGFDAKSRLQEHCQKISGALPIYRIDKITGPDHNRWYEISVEVGGQVKGRGRGQSKKRAEEMAAAEALEKLKIESA